METDIIADMVLKMEVPLEVKYDKLEALKWRLQQAVDLTKSYLINELVQNLDVKTYKNK